MLSFINALHKFDSLLKNVLVSVDKTTPHCESGYNSEAESPTGKPFLLQSGLQLYNTTRSMQKCTIDH